MLKKKFIIYLFKIYGTEVEKKTKKNNTERKCNKKEKQIFK